ncbi:hypothetical protein KC19_3G208800 [Ceratodon purpureus]|uniref:Uncharacterized protein n=1 Tax=Ceratodon purpureus TaxID=3225 RepID=A0A8T0IPA1_CERPU|nr:hypothetical protein KC19_3G208800 [Ceratodon purpureus]
MVKLEDARGRFDFQICCKWSWLMPDKRRGRILDLSMLWNAILYTIVTLLIQSLRTFHRLLHFILAVAYQHAIGIIYSDHQRAFNKAFSLLRTRHHYQL